MKTRILTTALMILCTTAAIAENGHMKSEDSLYTSNLALVSGSGTSETNNSVAFTEFLPSGVTIQNSANLEEWVESREAWESEASGMEAVNLEGWYESRESWEQESSELTSFSPVVESVNMEEWIGSRESWEQESSATDLGSIALPSVQLDKWVSDRETWEQEVSASDLANRFNGTFQQEWIKSKENWEQK